MSEQTPLKKSAVVGEDGELLQPDMTVDPEAYSEFVATYVRRDPLWFRMREYFREHRFISWILIFFGLCMASRLVEDLFSNSARLGDDIRSIILIILGTGLVIGILAKIVYVILQTDIRP